MDAQLIRDEQNGQATDKETLYLLGGAALVLVGAGLILSNPLVRKYMAQMNIGGLAKELMPDLDRYLKLRSM
jgi:hypothetical protein